MPKTKKIFIIVFFIGLLSCRAGIPPPPTSKDDAVNRATVRYGVDLLGGKRVELPAKNTGTGIYDFYSLFARIPLAGDPIYGIGIATNERLSHRDMRVSAEGFGVLKIDLRKRTPAPQGHSVTYVEATFTRGFLERVADTGMRLQAVSSKGSIQFTVPSWMFAALIDAADQNDPQRMVHAYEVKWKQRLQEGRKRYVEEHPELSDRLRDAILKGSIVLGMSADEARASWGNRSHVNKTVNAYCTSEQWVYGDGDYVYFEDGKITSWQSSQ